MTNTARIENLVEKIWYIKRYSDTRYFDWEETKKELRKLIQDNLPKHIPVEAVEKLKKKRISDWWYGTEIVDDFINDLDILLSKQQQDDTKKI